MRRTCAIAFAAAFIALIPFAASAQSSSFSGPTIAESLQSGLVAGADMAPPAQPASNGPMIVERLHSGLAAGADVKVTKLDGRTSELVGGYGGWLMDESVLVGGGGYWLASGSHDREMAYGGLVVQWFARSRERVGYGLKGLVGGGQATLSDSLTQVFTPRLEDLRALGLNVDPRFDVNQLIRNATTTRVVNVRVRRSFFLAEPEANVFFRLTDHFRVTAGAGYRFVGSEGRDDGRLRGATGTLSLQIS